MYTDLNHVILSGRMLKDPEIRATNTKQNVCTFKIACNKRKNSRTGEQGMDAINCVIWGKKADVIYKYFSCGDEIFIEGRITNNILTSANGKTYDNVVVNVRNFIFGQKSDASWERLKEKIGKKAGTDETPPLPTEEDMYAALGDDIENEELPF